MLNGKLNGNGRLRLGDVPSVERKYEKGRILYMPGDRAEQVYLLQAGRVQQYHLSLDGRKLVTTVLEPGDIFGITEIANGHNRHIFAEALEDCVVRATQRTQFRNLLLREPKATMLLLDTLARRLSHAENQLEALVFEPIRVRLARRLIDIAEDDVVAGYSHQDVSEMLGAYRETITVTLNEFKRQGLIAIERRRIEILDPERLNQIANTGRADRPQTPNTNGAPPIEQYQRLAA